MVFALLREALLTGLRGLVGGELCGWREDFGNDCIVHAMPNGVTRTREFSIALDVVFGVLDAMFEVIGSSD